MKAKTILSAGLGLLALAHGSPAGAAESSQALRWQSGGPAAEDGRLSGPVHLRAEVSTDHPVDGWSISVLTPAQEPLFGVVCSDDFARPRDTFTVDCRWDTTRYADQRPSANGHYLVRLMTRQAVPESCGLPGRPTVRVPTPHSNAQPTSW